MAQIGSPLSKYPILQSQSDPSALLRSAQALQSKAPSDPQVSHM